PLGARKRSISGELGSSSLLSTIDVLPGKPIEPPVGKPIAPPAGNAPKPPKPPSVNTGEPPAPNPPSKKGGGGGAASGNAEALTCLSPMKKPEFTRKKALR